MRKRDTTSGPPPVDLLHAVGGKIISDFYLLPEGGCQKLLCLGGDYTWGYRIY